MSLAAHEKHESRHVSQYPGRLIKTPRGVTPPRRITNCAIQQLLVQAENGRDAIQDAIGHAIKRPLPSRAILFLLFFFYYKLSK